MNIKEHIQHLRILPDSESCDFEKAIKEWHLMKKQEVSFKKYILHTNCQWCGLGDVMSVHRVKNQKTKRIRYVCSKCIQSFNVTIYYRDEGKVEGYRSRKGVLSLFETRKHQHLCTQIFQLLCDLKQTKTQKNEILKSLNRLKTFGYLTPIGVCRAISYFRNNNIEFPFYLFKINLEKKVFNTQLKKLEESDLKILWSCLDPCQKQKAMKLNPIAAKLYK